MNAPASRRGFLAASTAAVATAGSSLPALAAAPDPVFALIEEERLAWDAFDVAIGAVDAAEDAFKASGLDRRPRVQVGVSVTYITGDGRRIPEEERTEKPLYAYSRAEIEQAYAGRTVDDITMQTNGRHVRISEKRESDRSAALAAFDADAAEIKVARDRCRLDELHRLQEEASAAAEAAEAAVFTATPTTPAGFLAMLALFDDREENNLPAPHDAYVAGIFAAVRSIIGGRT